MDKDEVKEPAKEAEHYYSKLVAHSKKVVTGLQVVGLSKIAERYDVFDVLERAIKIIQTYKDGSFDYATATSDLLRLVAISSEVAKYAGLLRGSLKQNENIRRSIRSEYAKEIREKNLDDKSKDNKTIKLTDKTVEELSYVASRELTEELAQMASLAEIFSMEYDLLIHFTTILNSLLKREFEMQYRYSNAQK